MAYYEQTGSESWKGRIDGTDPDLLRWHQVIQLCDVEKLPAIKPHQQGIALLGFCSHEGVRRNQGRVGAAGGPAAIRAACSNFPVVAHHMVMVDAGNIVVHDDQLEAGQELLGKCIAQLRTAGYLPVVLGGGHETALGGFFALQPARSSTALGVINFDAHFDLRTPDAAIGSTSGTWAWQIMDGCDRLGIPLHYLVVGVQPYSNTRRLFETAEAKNFPYFLAEHFTNDQLHRMLQTINGIIAHASHLLLSVDMDVFAAPYAPGVSAASFNGIAPNAMFKRLLRHIVLSGKVACIDISEVNPDFDVDSRTSRLAAALVFDIIQAADMNAEYPG